MFGSVGTDLMDAWKIFGWFVTATLIAVVLGICGYGLIFREKWPLSDRIGYGFIGSALGTFAGGLLALGLNSDSRSSFAVTVIAGIVGSIGFQRRGFLGDFDDLFWL